MGGTMFRNRWQQLLLLMFVEKVLECLLLELKVLLLELKVDSVQWFAGAEGTLWGYAQVIQGALRVVAL